MLHISGIFPFYFRILIKTVYFALFWHLQTYGITGKFDEVSFVQNNAVTQFVKTLCSNLYPCTYRHLECHFMIDLTLPPLPEEEYPLPVRSICLNLFRKTLYRLPPLFAEDGRGLRTANISKWQPQKTRH